MFTTDFEERTAPFLAETRPVAQTSTPDAYNKAEGEGGPVERLNLSQGSSRSCRNRSRVLRSRASADRIAIINLLNPPSEPAPAPIPGNSQRNIAACGDHPRPLENRATEASSLDRKRCRRFWTQDEDDLLTRLVRRDGPHGWAQLAKSFVDRTGPQVRARWTQVLRFEDSNRPYTQEEDAHILDAQRRYGNKWVKIAAGMKNRAGNGVKNRFNALRNAQPESRTTINRSD